MRGTHLFNVVSAMQFKDERNINLLQGYAVGWSGQLEYLEHASVSLNPLVPLTLVDFIAALLRVSLDV